MVGKKSTVKVLVPSGLVGNNTPTLRCAHPRLLQLADYMCAGCEHLQVVAEGVQFSRDVRDYTQAELVAGFGNAGPNHEGRLYVPACWE